MPAIQYLDLELALIQKFFKKSKQAKYSGYVNDPELRYKLIEDLHHMNFLDLDKFDGIEGHDIPTITKFIKDLTKKKECYIISEIPHLDATVLDLKTALSEVVASDAGSILIFGDAEVIYAEAEGFNYRYLSRG